MFIRVRKDFKWGYVDSNTGKRIDCQFDWADNFVEEWAIVRVNWEYGVIDSNGNTVIPFKYDLIKRTDLSGFFEVRLSGMTCIVNTEQKLFDFNFSAYPDDLQSFSVVNILPRGLYSAIDDDQIKLYRDGRLLCSDYNSLSILDEYLIMVKNYFSILFLNLHYHNIIRYKILFLHEINEDGGNLDFE